MIKYRYGDFSTFTARCSQTNLIENSDTVFRIAWDLFLARWNGKDAIRLIGVGIIHDIQGLSAQPELFDSQDSRKGRLERTIATLNKNPITHHDRTSVKVVKATTLMSKKSRKRPIQSETRIDSQDDPL